MKKYISKIDNKMRVLIPDHIVFRSIGGESVILNTENEYYYGLDEVGTRLWELLAQNYTIQQALNRLLEEFNVSDDVLKSDIHDLLQDLIENDLIEVGLETED